MHSNNGRSGDTIPKKTDIRMHPYPGLPLPEGRKRSMVIHKNKSEYRPSERKKKGDIGASRNLWLKQTKIFQHFCAISEFSWKTGKFLLTSILYNAIMRHRYDMMLYLCPAPDSRHHGATVFPDTARAEYPCLIRP